MPSKRSNVLTVSRVANLSKAPLDTEEAVHVGIVRSLGFAHIHRFNQRIDVGQQNIAVQEKVTPMVPEGGAVASPMTAPSPKSSSPSIA